ncbi:helix-turn-helix domain-containing protein [Allomuricauda sp. SCSIO 65647]|uniref:helix-turn-helix domain-containing protein n=1 Tax=Allomuricauda sp. SCSIO 65647 TaxID=2908843 RepID=UPI001F310C1C|nr:helix-turn-helix domain-containing protein [Muricauda sp. SCSIO 65647]UJH66400.1 helix-turn-helix domain-containing protein [Muricauda sp. SCSIO 65647]
MDMIFTIGIFTSLFFFFLLLNKKNKSLPDTVLAFWMLMVGIHLTSTYIYTEGYWEIYPHFIGITAPLPLLYGPMLYMYVVHSIKDGKKIRNNDFWHFLPVIVAYLYMFKFYFFYSAEEKSMIDNGEIDDFGTFGNVLVVAIIISAIAYTVISYRLLRRHRKLIEDNFSNDERISLGWLKSFIWGVGIIFLTVALILISRDLLGVIFPFNPEFIFYSMIVFSVLCLGYFGIRHQNIFTDNKIFKIEEDEKSSYRNSGLKEDFASLKHKELLDLMAEQKPYLEPNLNLNTMAGKLDLPLHHLSQIINQFEEQNFNDFVNKYRVEEFIQRASKDRQFSFLALALDSGFNSKSTFNSVFKKHKGVTPSKFMANYTPDP